MKQFKGRVIVPGTCRAEALVSRGGFNTLASYQMALMFGDKQVKCGDQNNADIYKKPMLGKALCLPMTIGSTTGGMVLYTACAMGKQPACMLFSMPPGGRVPPDRPDRRHAEYRRGRHRHHRGQGGVKRFTDKRIP